MAYRLGVDVGGTFTDLVLVGPTGSSTTSTMTLDPETLAVLPDETARLRAARPVSGHP
jgi:N-methylhydantoinase A/oxoprolinase/acetone carboxylase beta subunit